MDEKIIHALIDHIKDFAYWSDCAIYFDDQIWADYDVSDIDETDTIKFVKEDDEINYCVINKNQSYKKDFLKIRLLERMGGLLYSDDCNPRLEYLSPEAEEFMDDHLDMYTISNHWVADGAIALLALETFLSTYDLIIVDWDVSYEGIEDIIIAKKSNETLELRKKGYGAFKRAIKYEMESVYE